MTFVLDEILIFFFAFALNCRDDEMRTFLVWRTYSYCYVLDKLNIKANATEHSTYDIVDFLMSVGQWRQLFCDIFAPPAPYTW